jgi:tetratricopeptide (TPR) repeat protein
MLRSFLPATGAARVVITSNQQAIAYLGEGVPVDVFSEAEALTFLAARTGQADAAGAKTLAEELGFLPLALAQAAAVIAGQHLSYGTYLDRLRRLPVEELMITEQYPTGMAATVLYSLENVRAGDHGRACGALMDLMAVLSPSGIRRFMIHAAGAAGLPDREEKLPALTPEALDRALARLAGVSLLTFSVDGSAVTVHRLVMRVIREDLAITRSLGAVCISAARLLAAQATALEQTWHEDRAATRDLVEQTVALVESAARIRSDNDLNTRLLHLRGWALWFLNELAESGERAIVIGEGLITDYEQTSGPDDLEALTARNNLALAYRIAGRTDKAISLHQQALAGRERILGPDDPHTLQSRNNLASAYRMAGRTDEALILHQQALAGRERILGPDDPDILQSRHNLALAFQEAGRTDEAVSLHEQTLAARERILGSDHPHTLISRHNLAIAYQGAGRADEAVSLLEQTLAARERTLGPDHPETLQSRRRLAAAHRVAGREEEAQRLEG